MNEANEKTKPGAMIMIAPLAALAFLVGCGDSDLVTKGEPPVKPSARITGSPGQILSLGERYFDVGGGSKRTTTVSQTIYLTDEGSWESKLEEGRDGLAVDLVIPTDEPVVLEIFLDGKLHEKIESNAPSRLRVTAGKTTDEEEIARDVRAGPDDRKFMKSLIDGMFNGTIGEMISTDSKRLGVDAVLVTEMMRVAKKRFGEVKSLHPERWSKALNDDEFLIYRMDVEFEDGSVLGLSLFTEGGELVAVSLRNVAFEKDWWEDAAFGDTYVSLGKAVVSDFIEKRFDEAHSKLGATLKEKLSVEKLRDYREAFSGVADSGIAKIEFADREVVKTDNEIDRWAQLVFRVTFGDGKPGCTVRVTYNFAIGSGWKIGEISGLEMEAN